MSVLGDWKIPSAAQPQAKDYSFDLNAALDSVVALHALAPQDAFTAGVLGTERGGQGVVIRPSGIVLTIGYLIIEAESIWLRTGDDRVVPAHGLAFDQETGFGLVQALAPLNLPAMPFGQSADLSVGEYVVIGGAGGPEQSVAARIVARQEFAGYWEYVIDDAIFAAPAHPHWGGAPLIGPSGDLLGIGSLQLEQRRAGGTINHVNMIVPIDLLSPILDDLLQNGRANRPPRPWLGLYAAEAEDNVVIVGIVDGAPADQAGLRQGDMIIATGGVGVTSLAGLFRHVWSLGPAGVEVPMMILRDNVVQEVTITSGDRNRYLKAPRLH